MTRHLETEVLVIGGGPAGATVAGGLAKLGHRVILCDDSKRRHPVPVETLLPAARHALERAGIDLPIAGLQRSTTGNGTPKRIAFWGSDEPTEEADGEPDEVGFRVTRGSFDAALRNWARERGAEVFEGHRAVSSVRDGGRVTFRTGSEEVDIDADVVVVASGRRTPAWLRPIERLGQGVETASLGLVVDRPDLRFADHEVIEAVECGWHWWMPIDDETCSLTVFLDAAQLREHGATAMFDRALATSLGPARAALGRRPSHASRATQRLLRSGSEVLLIGDASSTIDPLSSQGEEKAIASGENATAIVHTMLSERGLAALARDTLWRWERGLWLGHRRTTARFHAEETRFPGAPFWLARSVDPTPSSPALSQSTELVRSPRIRACELLVRRGPRYERESGFSLDDPAQDQDPLSHVGPVAIEPLLEAFASPKRAHDGLVHAASDPRIYVQSQRSTIEAIAVLHQRGFLVEQC